MADPQKDHLYTYKDYRSWPEEERWELIHGEAFCMSPAPGRNHQGLLTALITKIGLYFEDKPCEVYAAPFDVRLPEEADREDDDIDTVVQPDIAVFCDKSYLDDKGAHGPPDWIVEILSPSTAAKDRKIKFRLYEEQGVKEYWIVSPWEKTVTVFVLGPEGAYGRPDVYTGDDAPSPALFPDLVIDLAKVFKER